MSVTLHGYRYSVYAWIARLVLAEKGVDWTWQEADPFADPPDPALAGLHPFGRVPVLVHGAVMLYETVAITTYVDAAFDGPALTPADPLARARMAQVISVIDSYAYWPLVRQVFAHGRFRQARGEGADPDIHAEGLKASPRVLAALQDIMADAEWVTGDTLTLADLHMAPMIAYLADDPGGAHLLAQYPRLQAWFDRVSVRPAFVRTRPALS